MRRVFFELEEVEIGDKSLAARAREDAARTADDVVVTVKSEAAASTASAPPPRPNPMELW